MVLSDNCTQLIFKEFPEFLESQYWKEHVELKEYVECIKENSRPRFNCFYNEITAFSHFVIDLLNEEEPRIQPKKIFDFIEMLMLEGDKAVQEAVATCFLENLINATSWETLKPESFTHLLGNESRDYCRGWDEFTGVKTKGV